MQVVKAIIGAIVGAILAAIASFLLMWLWASIETTGDPSGQGAYAMVWGFFVLPSFAIAGSIIGGVLGWQKW